MKSVTALLTIIVVSLACSNLSAQDNNPFMQMAGKKYADYSQDLQNELYRYIELDTIEARNMIRQIEEVAEKTGSIEWKLLAEYFESEPLRMIWNIHSKDADFNEKYLRVRMELLEKVKKANIRYLELKVWQSIIDYWWSRAPVKNYELVFEQYAILEKRLEDISSDDIPEKARYYVHIGNAYYFFREYPKAIDYFHLALKEKDKDENQFWKLHAYNGLGLCYSALGDYNRSDSCFDAITHTKLLAENESDRNGWNGITEGEMGNNMVMRGELDKAIPLFKSSVERMLKTTDYAFVAGSSVDLASVLLKKGKPEEAKQYIDLAVANHFKPAFPRNNPLYYETLSKYYLAIGNEKLGIAYMDSMLIAKKHDEEQFSAILLLRMEQKEAAKQQQELVREKEKRQQMQLRLLALFIGFMVIFSLLGVVFALYRRKQAAYRELVRKSQEWAQSSVEYKVITAENKEFDISENDRRLFEQMQQLLQLECLYRDPAVNIDEVARRMKVNKTYLSRAVNHSTGKNFNIYINEYRIKEAVLLITKGFDKYSLEGLALEVGFNDRKTFYTAFKKITGLSPSSFRDNVRKK